MPQRLGQHFLNNVSVIKKIIAALDLRSGETIIEIGPGKGALTLPLADICAEIGCHIIGIEKDSALANQLTSKLVNKNIVEIIQGDALKELPRLISHYTLNANRYTLVGNIPYYITGHLLRVISELERKPERTVLMIQKEVAVRLTAKPGKMNLLAAATQIWADVSVIATLKPEDFSPAPKVESAVITLKLKTWNLNRETVEHYYQLIHAAFKQPRKTLLNNLSEGFGRSKADFLPILQQLSFTEKTRGQELRIEDLIALAALSFSRDDKQ